ncbi:MAG TPA: TonB-dependent receptor [Steroidobacteraceae bacterium]|nr:TonB-dependent receptor [Steroidobacteraceae bacterium]
MTMHRESSRREASSCQGSHSQGKLRSSAARPAPRVATAFAAAICLGALSSLVWAQDQSNAPAGQAAADQTAQSAQAPVPGATGSALQEVVVTAERRAENVQTTPIAVTAITGAQLEANEIKSIGDLTTVTPALSVINIGAYNLINIRGVGDALGETPITSGVTVIHDGLDDPLGVGNLAPMFDLADVEVLRGPQGTFIGGNAEGGAIEFTSANPTFTGTGGYATVQFGIYHDNLNEAAVNLPVSDTLAFRLALHTETENSFYDTKTTITGVLLPPSPEAEFDPGNTNQKDMRLSMLWKPTDHWQLLLKTQQDTNSTDGTPYNINPDTFSPLVKGGPCPAGDGTAPNCHSADYPYYSGSPFTLNEAIPSTPFQLYQQTYTGESRLTLNDGIVWRFFGGNTVFRTPSLTPSCYCAADFGWALGVPGGNVVDDIETDLISPTTGKLQWIAGMSDIYSNQSFDTYSYGTGPGPTAGLGNNPASGYPNGSTQDLLIRNNSGVLPTLSEFPSSTLATRAYGIFGQITWQFTDTLQLQAGLRGNWDNNWNDADGYLYDWFGSTDYSCPATQGGNTGAGDHGSSTTSIKVPTVYPCNFPTSKTSFTDANGGTFVENHQTGKVGLNWQATPDEYFYAFVARAYKPGVVQFHAIGTTTPDASAETLDDYELGWKGTYDQHRLTTQVGAYYSSYDDMQQNLFNPKYPANGGVANVPHATIWGLEGNLQWQMASGFGTTIAVAYTHSGISPLQDIATYKEPAGFGTNGPGGVLLPQCPAGVTTSTTCFDYTPYIENLKGSETPYAPALTANITVQYGFHVGEGTIQPRIQFSHTDKQWANILQEDPYYLMVQRNILNAYLDYIQGPWTVDLYSTNVTNDVYTINDSGNTVLYGPPLQYGVKMTRTF